MGILLEQSGSANCNFQQSDEPVIDYQQLMKQMDNNQMLLTRISEIFVKRSDEHLLQLQNAILANNLQEVASLAHKLKGSVGQFTKNSPYQAVLQLETMAKNANGKGMQTVFDTLVNEITKLKLSFFWLDEHPVKSPLIQNA